MSTLDLDTIQKLLGEEKQKAEQLPKADLWYKHGFEKRMKYLFELPYERMFQPFNINQPEFFQCIGCGRKVKDCESHFNWHKRELHDD